MRPDDVIGVLAFGVVVLGAAAIWFATLWLKTRERLIRLEHGGMGRPGDDRELLERMERSIESVAIEVERLGESDRFAAQLLAARVVGPAEVKAPGGRVITPH